MAHLPIQDLLIDDKANGIFRVSQRSFTDPAILVAERREIFDRCWLYAGHESELPKAGDFISRKVAERPLLIVRDREAQLRAFYNRCLHRGNTICREKSGNAEVFSCFYHAWSYNLNGELIGVPGEDSYSAGFKRSDMALQSPRIDNYRGLIFVSFDPDIVSLREYLGGAREYIDLMLDLTPDGAAIPPGAQAYSMDANWKLLVENSMDAYHFATTHQRYLRQFLPDVGVNLLPGGLAGRGVAFAGGHSMAETRTLDSPINEAKNELAELQAKLIGKFGPERADLIFGFNRNLFIFPNLILISAWRTIRTFYPIAPGYLEVNAWALLPNDAGDRFRELLFDNFISFLGPGGFGTPDDVAALEGCQRGFNAMGHDHGYSDISRGMGNASPIAVDELQMRGFWRQWHARMKGKSGPIDCGDREISSAQ